MIFITLYQYTRPKLVKRKSLKIEIFCALIQILKLSSIVYTLRCIFMFTVSGWVILSNLVASCRQTRKMKNRSKNVTPPRMQHTKNPGYLFVFKKSDHKISDPKTSSEHKFQTQESTSMLFLPKIESIHPSLILLNQIIEWCGIIMPTF